MQQRFRCSLCEKENLDIVFTTSRGLAKHLYWHRIHPGESFATHVESYKKNKTRRNKGNGHQRSSDVANTVQEGLQALILRYKRLEAENEKWRKIAGQLIDEINRAKE